MKTHRLWSAWSRSVQRSLLKATKRATRQALKVQAAPPGRPPAVRPRAAVSDAAAAKGRWTTGIAMGLGGARRYRLFRPPAAAGERLPLLVMLHGCGQDAAAFAASTRMNSLALRQRFIVLYPEQDRLANAQGCWNWFDVPGRGRTEAALILQAISQVCQLRGADPQRVAIAGLSAGAGMAALVATQAPERFKAVVMHSGVPPGAARSAASALAAMQGRRSSKALATAQGLPPLLVLHGSQDRVVSPRNAQAAALLWAQATGARPGAERGVRRGSRYPMLITDYKLGGRTLATLAEIQGLGHAWSGGAASQAYGDPRGPDASRLLWAFVARQFGPAGLPAAGAAAGRQRKTG